MRNKILILIVLSLLLVLGGCGSESVEEAASEIRTESPVSEESVGMRMIIGDTEVPVTWETNDAVAVLKEMLPKTVTMTMYGGFEQVGAIGESLPTEDVRITAEYGDIMLYSGDQIVVFYGSNSWSYTPLGHIDLSQQELTDLLSNGDVTITITTE